MLSKSTVDTFSSREFKQFLDSALGEDDNYLQAHYASALRYADATVCCIYHRLAFLLESHPDLAGVRPVFQLTTESDGNHRYPQLRVRLELLIRNPDGPAIPHECGYQEYPEALADCKAFTQAFDDALEICECVDVGVWEDLSRMLVFNRKGGYANLGQIQEDMEKDVGALVTELRQWRLDRGLPVSEEPSRSGPRM